MSTLIPFDDARALLTAANLGYPIQWPNEPWTQPATMWISFGMTGDSLMPIEMNGGAWQEDGRLFCHIYTPANQGSRLARQLAKTITNVFRNLGARPVVYHNASTGEGLADDVAGSWWALSVMVEYRVQDVPDPAPY